MRRKTDQGIHGRKLLAGTAVAGLCLFGYAAVHRLRVDSGSARVVSIEAMEDADGEACLRPPRESATENLFSSFETPVHAQGANDVDLTRPAVREILDTAPIFSSVGVDNVRNEVYLQDSNLWSIRVYSRTANAKPGEGPTEPRRIISGDNSEIQFNSCVWVDPGSGDIYSVENDTGDSIVVFPNDATGDPKPKRHLHVTHRAQSMALNPASGELFLSVQYPPQVAIYSSTADKEEKPIRLIEGPKTNLSDVHGLALDTKNKLLYLNSWGNISDYHVAGSGRFEDPSIEVFPESANGDVAPMHVIQGDKTQLDWPGAMSIDPGNGDLYVANDVGQSILVFRKDDQGNVAPYRVIKGAKTHLSFPTGVFVDDKNKELWATNLGNSSATVYPLTATGDVTPLRIIRGADENKQSLKFGKTQALAYDSKRDEILVPN
jgi:6-phosphogluconolactonase (cycloisomerase 2 family)